MEELGLVENVARQFAAGGWAMYPLLLLGMLLGPGMLAAFVVSLAARRSRVATLLASGLLVVGALLVLLVAFGGWLHAARTVDQVLAMVNPEDVETIRAAGRSESLTLVVWGLFFAMGPLSLGVALSGLGLARHFGAARPAAS